jgi:hypothetical protein
MQGYLSRSWGIWVNLVVTQRTMISWCMDIFLKAEEFEWIWSLRNRWWKIPGAEIIIFELRKIGGNKRWCCVAKQYRGWMWKALVFCGKRKCSNHPHFVLCLLTGPLNHPHFVLCLLTGLPKHPHFVLCLLTWPPKHPHFVLLGCRCWQVQLLFAVISWIGSLFNIRHLIVMICHVLL